MTNSRQKGKRGELEVARLFRDMRLDAIRSQQYSGQGLGPGDVILYDLDGDPLDVVVEVKRRETYSVAQLLIWVQEARESGPSNTAMVVHRQSRHPWQVTFLLSEHAKLVKDLQRAVD